MSELIVHQLPGGFGHASISPFCLKLDLHLRLLDIPFRTVVDPTPFKGPKRKLPWIEHAGRRIGDSGFIIEYLVATFGRDADAGLSAAERAVAHALRRLVEENLYWTMVHDRWIEEANWRQFRHTVFAAIPLPLRYVVAPLARRSVRRQLEGHGIARHGADEIHAIGIRDIGALADWLGDKPYLMGDRPTGIDATAYGLLANILAVPIASPVKDYGLDRPNLVRWLARIRDRYYP